MDVPAGRRAAIVAGLRTPFARSGSVLRDVPAVDLARHAARELLYRTELAGKEVDQVIWGQVVPSVLVPNVAREVSLLPQFPRTIPAYSLNRACASSAQAVADAHDQIVQGFADVVLAGGVESLSDVPILHSRGMTRILMDASKAKSLGQRLATFARIRPKDLIPVAPAIAEPSTGESMGQSAEKMAKENGIARAAQDEIALRSHQRQRDPHRPLARGAGTAQAGLRSSLRHRHCGECIPPHRRRFRRPGDGGREGEGARLQAPRLCPCLCRLRGRSRLAAAAGARLRGPQGARACRPDVEGARPRRDPRGVRVAGAEQHPGVGIEGVGRPARAQGSGGGGELGHHQCQRRVDRDRTPLRGDGDAHHHPARQRDDAARCAVRADLDLCAGRYGDGDDPGACLMPVFRIEPEGDVALLIFDSPGQSVNTLSAAARSEFDTLIPELAADATVKGLVLISGKPENFIAGADIEEFTTFRTAEEAATMSHTGKVMIQRMADFPKPVVAAIHGACIGGGCELALACSWRIATDSPKTIIGLPETLLGIIPGAGGSVRLPRLIGLRAALDIILAGKNERAAKALKLGLIDELVHPSILRQTAIAAARRLAKSGPVVRTPQPPGLLAAILDRTKFGRRVVASQARKQVLKKTQGNYPAQLKAIEVALVGLDEGMTAGFAAESKAFGELAVTDVSRKLVGLFFADTALKKEEFAPGAKATEVRRLGVLGAGFMGAGIAGTAVTQAAVEARMKDADLK